MNLHQTAVADHRIPAWRKGVFLFLFLIGAFSMTIFNLDTKIVSDDSVYLSSKQLGADQKFVNDRPSEQLTFKKTLGLIKRALFEKKTNTVPSHKIPVMPLTREAIEALPLDKASVVRLGHSSLLVKLSNQLWLIDPVFSERASPFSFMGPKRFHSTPIALEALPYIDGVIISHNHYDHMDEKTLKKLKHNVGHFVMPVGNAAQLAAWGVPSEKLIELDWWQSFSVEGITLVSTPAQHFSGRGLRDKDKALWSSWVIVGAEAKLFFSGDSGYFDGFKTIGERYGPFDLTMMETGAYDDSWSDVHMSPKDSAQAHLDLKGRKMLPVHNGTFDLAFHEWTDPFEQLVDIANREWVDLMTPKMGQVLTLGDEQSVDNARDEFWWEKRL